MTGGDKVLKVLLGMMSGIIGVLILTGIVLEVEYLVWAEGNFIAQIFVALVGLAMIHIGYRLVTSVWTQKR